MPPVGLSFAQKEIAGRLESGTHMKKDEIEWRAKRDGISREIIPADGSNSAHRMNEDFGTSPSNGGRPSDKSAAYLSPMGAATDIR